MEALYETMHVPPNTGSEMVAHATALLPLSIRTDVVECDGS